MSIDVKSRHSARAARPVTEDAPMMIVSADTHVGPRLKEDLRPYCPKKYLAAYDEFLASPGAQADLVAEMWEQAFSDNYRNARKQNMKTAGHYDPRARLRDMDHDGVAGGVIFHNSLNHEPLPFDARKGLTEIRAEDRELAGVGRQMYNRWLSDFCSVERGRHVGLAYLPLWDVDASITELEWCAEHGLGGVNYPAPGQPGLVPPEARECNELFAACAALDMTLATHIGTVAPRVYDDRWNDRDPTSMHFGLLDAGDWGLRTISALVIFGVFERHPSLKLVVTEVPGIYWNELARKMDSLHDSPIRRTEHQLPRLPSEYMATNVWMGNSFQSREEAITAIEIGRADRFCWGSDYPHPEGTFYYSEDPDQYPMTRLSLSHTYHDLPLDQVRLLVGENLLEAYPRFDAGALHDVAERAGMTVDEISTAPDLSEHSYLRDTATLGFRSHGPWS